MIVAIEMPPRSSAVCLRDNNRAGIDADWVADTGDDHDVDALRYLLQLLVPRTKTSGELAGVTSAMGQFRTQRL